MADILISSNEHIWICDSVALALFCLLTVKTRKVTSSLLTLVIAILFSGLIIQYRALVMGFDEMESQVFTTTDWTIGFIVLDSFLALLLVKFYQSIKANEKQWFQWLYIGFVISFLASLVISQFGPLWLGQDVPDRTTWLIVAYYLGTPLFDVVVVYSIHQVHLFSKIQYGPIAKMYMLAFFVAGCLHLFKFSERVLLNTNYFSDLYTWTLVSINITTTVVVMFIGSMAVYQFYLGPKKGGVLWQL